MDYEAIKTEYLCYLMNRIGLEAEGTDGYLRLCETLQEIAFLPQTDMDENRCSDCMDLREEFAQYDFPDSEEDQMWMKVCLDMAHGESGTMLELLTVIAEKMAFETCDSQYEASTRKWFLEILGNCGLGKHWSNEDFEDEGNEEVVRDAMNTVIFRKTGWDGEGGLFPLAYPQYDQRKVEIIIQMNNYLEENYEI